MSNGFTPEQVGFIKNVAFEISEQLMARIERDRRTAIELHATSDETRRARRIIAEDVVLDHARNCPTAVRVQRMIWLMIGGGIVGGVSGASLFVTVSKIIAEVARAL